MPPRVSGEYAPSRKGSAGLETASDHYAAIERAAEDYPCHDVVLVSAESVTSLRRAYPNYFSDTTEFPEDHPPRPQVLTRPTAALVSNSDAERRFDMQDPADTAGVSCHSQDT